MQISYKTILDVYIHILLISLRPCTQPRLPSLPLWKSCRSQVFYVFGYFFNGKHKHGFTAGSLRTLKNVTHSSCRSPRESIFLIFHGLQKQFGPFTYKEVAVTRIRSDCSKLLWKKIHRRRQGRRSYGKPHSGNTNVAPRITRKPILLAELLVTNPISLFVIDRRLRPIAF